jgi:hypothetical protein
MCEVGIVLEATFSVGVDVFLAAHARVFDALQTRATTEESHNVVGDVVVAVVAIVVVVVVVAAAVVEGMVVAVVTSRRSDRLGVGCGQLCL